MSCCNAYAHNRVHRTPHLRRLDVPRQTNKHTYTHTHTQDQNSHLRPIEDGQLAEGAAGEGVARVRRARLPDAQGDPAQVHEEVRAQKEAAGDGGEDVAEDNLRQLGVLGVD
jgi:hypothetical protein